jgi:hypothetical protein
MAAMMPLKDRLWREYQVQAIVSYYSHGGVRGIKFGIDIGSVNQDGSPRLLWKQGGNLNKYKCSFTMFFLVKISVLHYLLC